MSARSVLVAGLAAAALLAAGCTSSVSGTPETSGSAPATSAQRGAPSSAAPGKSCTVSVGRGVISMSGSGGRASTKNGQSSFSCGNGPLIAVGPIDANGVTLTVDTAPVVVAVGSSASVGPYQVDVQSIDNGVAKLTVAT